VPQPPAPPPDYSLTLPVERDQLALFIAGLLGKPQTIERFIRGPFEVKRSDLENLYHLIEQRISSQNKSSLVGFTAKIVYHDNSSVLLNSLIQLQTYNEVKPLASTAIHLNWIYLIQFNNRNVLEKQQIELSIMANDLDADIEIDREFGRRVAITRHYSGLMQLRISHTDRTWGADLEALLTGYLDQFRIRLSGVRKFVANNSGWIGFAVAICLLLILLAGPYYASGQLHDNYVASLGPAASDIAALTGRIEMLSELISSQIASRYVVAQMIFFVLSIIASIAAGIFVEGQASQEKASALILTRTDADLWAKAASRANRSLLRFALSTPITLALGVLANYLFLLLTRFFAL
jgi:hypothetical protein